VKDSTAKRLSAFHATLFRFTRGKIGKRLVNNDMLLLSTVGTKTGIEHTVPLLYLRDGEDIVVIASWGGRPESPQWYRNLQSTPEITIQILGEQIPVTARTANATERARLWPLAVASYDGYAEYQSRTTREIPVVILSRR
jgi:F420H(2)-dependent quinone reductase